MTKATPTQQEVKQPAGLSHEFKRFAGLAGRIGKDTLPALKKFGPVIFAADPPVAAAVLAVIVAGSALGHGLNHVAKQQQAKSNSKPNSRTPKPSN